MEGIDYARITNRHIEKCLNFLPENPQHLLTWNDLQSE